MCWLKHPRCGPRSRDFWQYLLCFADNRKPGFDWPSGLHSRATAVLASLEGNCSCVMNIYSMRGCDIYGKYKNDEKVGLGML